jgi:DNA-binding transcriptional LysR family regulator
VPHDLTSLRVFVSVAECGNLTRAAEREHLAVSAISKRIAELEDRARTPLLVRYPRGVGLTPAGQSLLHHARQMLQLVRHMDEELGEYAGGVKGHIRLHAVASAITQFLPEELQAFLTRYPKINVALEERVGSAIVRAVAEGAADVGIVSDQTARQGLAEIPYHSDQLVLGVPNGHPLARRKSVLFEEALAYPFVGPHADSSLAQLMARAAKASGKPLQQRIQVSSFDAMCRLVETRLGITLLPAGVIAPLVAQGRIRSVALREAWASRRLLIVVRDPQELNYVTRTLIEHLSQSAAAAAGAADKPAKKRRATK